MIRALLLPLLLAAPGAPSLPAAEDIRDVRAPVSIPAPAPWGLYVAIGLGVAAAAAAVVLWRRRVRAIAAHERAFRGLEAARALMDPALAREYATAVSDTVRRYISERFGIPARRRTTWEFLESVAGNPPPLLRDHLPPLRELLDFADRAKFGGWILAAAEMESMHASAWNLVAMTRAAEGRAS